ncbi:MAG: riboflavin biosynthesis protein RibD [Gammaproteobacteria bacterium CG_4_10_14_0_8_um_filter_38_16]|nr:MAG: riboflavin biosynthesis protein RibD [Gammaproteobacteria bacterium CG_4_10_14_0_8_um_filter_38_16]PJA02733.1 MAG: riboflavin biosynthesis protein RibD [Gammaproteobacteria bacterium CG_4_10_14_0_2_um_filter_38_22]PJB09811.1 MAG: riboflavin biosynthesis protein RibD [Gammaproteobacteria bacterium CG_4_9_14_3_um_filter_38_9]
MSSISHYTFMKHALALAALGRCTVSPNPMVGCVIVQNNKVVGEGFHQKAGEAHAEIIALQKAGKKARGSVLYVTLEPCCHYGKTSPCVNALIEAGIQKIIVACLDPNPLVSGGGVRLLRAAGIVVEVGLCEVEAIALNEIFFHYMQYRRPFVICKWAMSLDGKTIVNKGDDKKISGVAAQKSTHQLREQVDAILIGANTARDDNPTLTARKIPGNTLCEKQPIRIVLCGARSLLPTLNLLDSHHQLKTILVTTEKNKSIFQSLQSDYVELLVVAEKNNTVSILDLLTVLAEKEITSLLVEGGMTTHQLFLKENCVNKTRVTVSPIMIGVAESKKKVTVKTLSSMDSDFCFLIDNEAVYV